MENLEWEGMKAMKKEGGDSCLCFHTRKSTCTGNPKDTLGLKPMSIIVICF
jgi:hypothetical protein